MKKNKNKKIDKVTLTALQNRELINIKGGYSLSLGSKATYSADASGGRN